MRTKKDSVDWVNHFSEFRDEMRRGDIIIWTLGRGDLAKEQDFRAWESVEEFIIIFRKE